MIERNVRSLTIREGVSVNHIYCFLLLLVPSLYVRVYRYEKHRYESGQRSLIICEGVSPLPPVENIDGLFPHYM